MTTYATMAVLEAVEARVRALEDEARRQKQQLADLTAHIERQNGAAPVARAPATSELPVAPQAS